MDDAAIEHSDSDSGDSWILLDNNSNYADDAPDVPDHPAASSTAENHDKDDDTDGISIISDSEPESSTPCQVNYEHYLSQENSTEEHPIPQFIPVNSHLPNISNDSDKDGHDFLGDSNGKHKTYVHRRNKRLSTVLNIIMIGSVITAAGVAIGHMWGAKTDCSMHTPTNINKILSNLYKLQEENAYLRSKIKELTVFNIQTNQNSASKYHKCKKTFEEPLVKDKIHINDKFTKCVDDNKLLKSHMAEAVSEKLMRDEKNLNQEGKKWVPKQNEKFLKNMRQQKLDISDPKNNADIRKKILKDEYFNETKDLRYDRKSYADSLKYFEKVKKVNKGPDILLDSTDQSYSNVKMEGNNLHVKDFYKKDYLKGEIGSINENIFNKNSKMDLNKRKTDFGMDDVIFYDKQNIKKIINKTLKLKTDDIKKMHKPENGITEDILTFKNKENMKNDAKKLSRDKIKENNGFDINKTLKDNLPEEHLIRKVQEHKETAENHIQIESNKFSTESRNVDSKHTSKKAYANSEEYGNNLKEKKLKRKRETDSEEETKKDDRYSGQRKKPERKKHDRHQSLKKIKRKNKYEQWEMKGGLLKDFYELSDVSSEELGNIYNNQNVMDYENNINYFNDIKIDTNIGTNDDKNDKYAGHFKDMENIKGDTTNNDENDWLDKRASYRKEARKRLEQELFGKNAPNAAGWYFRRMRKREQSRDNRDNSTFKKFLKRNMNYKMKH